MQEHFAKLKFNYLEQETKERFLKSLMKDPSLVIEQADNWELGKRPHQMKEDMEWRDPDFFISRSTKSWRKA